MPYYEPIITQFNGLISDPVNRDYVLDQSAGFPYEIVSFVAITTAGTCTAALAIEGVAITGISAVACSSVETTGTATALNRVSEGQTLRLTISGVSAADNLSYTIKVRRV